MKNIASDHSITDRIETMAKRESFITVKDHKENFVNNPKYRLINAAKSELGKVSKVIFDDINSKIRLATGFNQWKNSQSVIEWFRNIDNKANCSFLSFDIAEFYPSISEIFLDKAILWAKKFTPITEQHVSIIKHARSSLLFNDGKPWVKQNSQSMFDVTMGSSDGAEVCELVGLFLLNELSQIFDKHHVGLYRDDGLMLPKGTSGRLAGQTRKKLHQLFEQFGLKITVEINHQTVNFLDITFNLIVGSYRPFRKPNNEPLYISSYSNHPPSIIRQLPVSINERISRLSSNKQAFESSAPLYEQALILATIKLNYSTQSITPHMRSKEMKEKYHLVQPTL